MSHFKLTEDQLKEIVKCSESFSYFCENYVRVKSYSVTHPAVHQLAFKLHPFQERLAEHWESHRFSINSKFRQGGFTTLAVMYGLWKCLFQMDQRVMYVGKTDRDVRDASHLADYTLSLIPDWMKGINSKSDHRKKFDTGSVMTLMVFEAACGLAVNLLIIDEAAFIKDMDKHWVAMWPVISNGGRLIVQSTVKTDEDWFWDRLIDARAGVGGMVEFKCHYTDRPEFDNLEWEQEMRRNVGSGWESEFLQKPMRKVVEKPVKKSKWRRIQDDWEPSANLD